jgi:anti-anti-sigma factor
VLITSVGDARVGQHLCQLYDGGEELRAAVCEFVGPGLTADELVIHVTGSDVAGVRSYLSEGGVEHDAAFTRGQLRILSLPDMSVDHDTAEEVLATVVDRLTEILRTRAAGGYAAARMVSEVDALYGAETVEQMTARERLGGELVASHPMIGLCLYDRRLHGPGFLRLVEAEHHARVLTASVAYRDQIAAIARLGGGTGIRVSGELDLSNRDAWAAIVTEVVQGASDEVVIDLSEVSFIDAGGLGVLVAAAERNPGRRVVLASPGPMVREVLGLVGWDRLPNLVLDPSTPGG